jgi:general secretion pathway protein G
MAAIIVPNAMTYLKKAKVTAAKMKIEQFKMPLQQYQELKGNYPSTDEGLQALVTEKLIKEKDLKDPWGNPYQYRFPGENDQEEYEIWSWGADGKEGGEGFNADIKSWEGS